ncbi:hypothetical protein KCU88_g302, partial [Aureobasidium melanogenum]
MVFVFLLTTSLSPQAFVSGCFGVQVRRWPKARQQVFHHFEKAKPFFKTQICIHWFIKFNFPNASAKLLGYQNLFVQNEQKRTETASAFSTHINTPAPLWRYSWYYLKVHQGLNNGVLAGPTKIKRAGSEAPSSTDAVTTSPLCSNTTLW